MPSTAYSSQAHSGPQLDNRRIAAAAIDCAAPGLALLALIAGGLLTPAVLLVVLGWTLYYFFALESGGGQTLGKKLMNLRVVSTDGSDPSMQQFAYRNLVRAVDLPGVGLIAMLTSGDDRQRLGDRAAHTMVVDAGGAHDATTDLLEPAPKAKRPRRGLRGPELKLPKLRRASGPASTATTASAPAAPKRTRRGLGGPEIKLPTIKLPGFLGRGGRAPVEGPTPPEQPDGLVAAEAHSFEPDDSVPEVRTFDPFADDAPEPSIEVVHPEDESLDAAAFEAPADLDSDPMAGDETPEIQVVPNPPAYEDEDVTEEDVPDVQVTPSTPAYEDVAVADEDAPEVYVAPSEPVPPAPPAPVSEEAPEVHEHPEPQHSDAVRDDGSPRLNVKPIETVSPMELLMQEAQEHDEHDQV